MSLPLPPELKCRVYRNITNFVDIQNLLTIHQDDPEELSLIYECITTIENVPVRLDLDFIGKFRNLRNLNAPIYIYNSIDIPKIKYLRKLTKVTFIIDLILVSLELEDAINRILHNMPNNIDSIYFTDYDRLILYHYNKQDNFFAISTHNLNSIFDENLPDIYAMIDTLTIDELYLQLPRDTEYIDDIVAVANTKNMWISCPSYLLLEIFSIATNLLIRYELHRNQIILIDLEDDLDPDISYSNIKLLHGPFTIETIINVQNQLPNLQEIGICIPDNQPLNEVANLLTLLNPNIHSVIFYINQSRLGSIEEYFRRSQLYHEFYPITELRDYSIELYIEANLR